MQTASQGDFTNERALGPALHHSSPRPRDIQFGHMDGNDYINGLIMGEVAVPSFIILNTSNEQYFLPSGPLETMDQLLSFINSVLDGTAQAQGGDSIFQRVRRLAYDAKSTVMSVFQTSPVLGCFLFGLPLGVISLMCYGICTAETDDGAEDLEPLKKEGLTDEEDDDEGQRQPMELEGPGDEGEGEGEGEPQEEKSLVDKKAD